MKVRTEHAAANKCMVNGRQACLHGDSSMALLDDSEWLLPETYVYMRLLGIYLGLLGVRRSGSLRRAREGALHELLKNACSCLPALSSMPLAQPPAT